VKSIFLPSALLALAALALGIAVNFTRPGRVDWQRQWPPYASLAKEAVLAVQDHPAPLPAEAAIEETEDERGQAMAQVAAEVESNLGIVEIGLAEALRFHRYGRDFMLWLDARNDELFQAGHIAGALQIHYYEQEPYLAAFAQAVAQSSPMALVVYCKGKDCHDSHFLAEDLQKQGFNNIYVYRDGYEDWVKAGGPVESAAGTTPAPTQAERPKGMFLEHLLRDVLPFCLGIFWLLSMWRGRITPFAQISALGILGSFFVFAAIPKILMPLEFAKNIWNYDIAPSWLINLGGIWLPMLELMAALALILPKTRRAACLILGTLLLLFVAAISYNLLRGHEFNCGCTTSKTFFSQIYLPGWNDKYTLLLRDFGLLMGCLLPLRRRP
jgi:rhodanese-related sulfurtransferase/uncharacterized membrane protein